MSKSIEKSESGPLEQNSCKMVEEFYAARPWIETRQGWVKLCVGVVDKINESIADIVVDRDCEPQRCGCASKGQTT